MPQADALAAFETGIQALEVALYQAGVTDGQALPEGGISTAQEQADIAAAVSAAVGPLNDQITAMGLAKSQEDALLASVQGLVTQIQALFPVPVPATT